METIRKRQSQTVTFKIDQDTRNYLDAVAKEHDTSRSEIIKAAIKDFRLSQKKDK